MDKYTLIHLLIILLMDLEFQVFYYCNTYLPCTWPRMFMGCVPKSVVMAFQVVILIYTHSMELEFPISHYLGVLRLLGFCQPLKQYLKPVLIFVFISLMPRCFHVYWLFGVSLLWFACLLPLSTTLSGYLPFVVILVIILCQLQIHCRYLILLCS